MVSKKIICDGITLPYYPPERVVFSTSDIAASVRAREHRLLRRASTFSDNPFRLDELLEIFTKRTESAMKKIGGVVVPHTWGYTDLPAHILRDRGNEVSNTCNRLPVDKVLVADTEYIHNAVEVPEWDSDVKPALRYARSSFNYGEREVVLEDVAPRQIAYVLQLGGSAKYVWLDLDPLVSVLEDRRQ